jgi:hypothetical protein
MKTPSFGTMKTPLLDGGWQNWVPLPLSTVNLWRTAVYVISLLHRLLILERNTSPINMNIPNPLDIPNLILAELVNIPSSVNIPSKSLCDIIPKTQRA